MDQSKMISADGKSFAVMLKKAFLVEYVEHCSHNPGILKTIAFTKELESMFSAIDIATDLICAPEVIPETTGPEDNKGE